LFITLASEAKLDAIRNMLTTDDGMSVLPTVPERWMTLYSQARQKAQLYTAINNALSHDPKVLDNSGPWMTALALILSSTERTDVRGLLLSELVYDCMYRLCATE
jgi:hypothetical protein